MRRLLTAATVAGAMFLTATMASAQAPSYRPGMGGQIGTPPYSPYLNLLRNNNSTLQNYYGLVRPEFQFRNSLLGLQQQVSTIGQTATGAAVDPETGLPFTGHSTQFLNTSHYFLNRGGVGAAPGPAAGGAVGSAGGMRPTATPARPGPIR
jgi:hypothetical protein